MEEQEFRPLAERSTTDFSTAPYLPPTTGQPITYAQTFAQNRPRPPTGNLEPRRYNGGARKHMNFTHETTPPGSDATVRFCWLRESLPGHLEYDAGLRIARSELLSAILGLHPKQQRTSASTPVSLTQVVNCLTGSAPLAGLPDWSRRRLAITFGPLTTEDQRSAAARNLSVLTELAGTLEQMCAGMNDPEVHLPFVDRRHWTNRFDVLATTRFVIHDGRIMPEPVATSTDELAVYQARLLAIASIDPTADFTLSFTYQQPGHGALARMFLPFEPDADLPDSESAFRLRVDLPASACRAWRAAPAEDTHAYFPVHARVSVAMQSALRRWFAFRWFGSFERFGHPYSAYPLLAYFVSTPFPGRRRTDFSYDTLGTEWIFTALRCARRPLRALLVALRRLLVDAGYPEMACSYLQADAKRILEKARRERRTLHSLVTADGAIVNHILKLGIDLREASDPRAAVSAAASAMESLLAKFRHYHHEQDLAIFAPAILFEATNALSMALGGEAELKPALSVLAAVLTPRPQLVPLPGEQQPLRIAS